MSNQNDRVNHPSHYTSHPSGIECIEITRHYCFAVGNAIKYLWRCGLKDENGLALIEKEIEDLKKAIWYIKDRIHQINPFKYFYPKTQQSYTVLQSVKIKLPDGNFKDAVLCTDGKETYAIDSEEFHNDFLPPSINLVK